MPGVSVAAREERCWCCQIFLFSRSFQACIEFQFYRDIGAVGGLPASDPLHTPTGGTHTPGLAPHPMGHAPGVEPHPTAGMGGHGSSSGGGGVGLGPGGPSTPGAGGHSHTAAELHVMQHGVVTSDSLTLQNRATSLQVGDVRCLCSFLTFGMMRFSLLSPNQSAGHVSHCAHALEPGFHLVIFSTRWNRRRRVASAPRRRRCPPCS